MAKKSEKERVRCIDCRHSELYQKGNDPVISRCPFLLYRQVARTYRICAKYEKSVKPKTITKIQT